MAIFILWMTLSQSFTFIQSMIFLPRMNLNHFLEYTLVKKQERTPNLLLNGHSCDEPMGCWVLLLQFRRERGKPLPSGTRILGEAAETLLLDRPRDPRGRPGAYQTAMAHLGQHVAKPSKWMQI